MRKKLTADTTDIIEIFTTARLEQELSMREVARRADLRSSSVSRMLAGNQPRLATIVAIAEALGYELCLVKRGEAR